MSYLMFLEFLTVVLIVDDVLVQKNKDILTKRR